jgi:anionic cell wall polymer biosynthesis LytR-Cps2A-Psr (LCP) family protein
VGEQRSKGVSPALERVPGLGKTARRRPWGARRTAALIFLLLLLAGLVIGLIAFLSFRKEVHASNRRVPASTKRALAPSREVLSEPQLVLSVFDRASLFARTDPDRHLISLLSIPSSAYLRTPGTTTFGSVPAGATELVRSARTVLNLQVTHIALLRRHDIPPLVDAIGGVEIQDPTIGGFGRPNSLILDGAEADHYLESAGSLGSATRRERERAMLEAIISRLASAASFSRLPHLARTFSANVATDLSPRDTIALALVRLRSKVSVQCALTENWQLERPHSKHVLQQFVGGKPAGREQARVFPVNGCRATALAAHVPRAVLFLSEHALALFGFVPELAAFAIACDLILLLMLFGVPQALIGNIRNRRTTMRRHSSKADVRMAETNDPVATESWREVLAHLVGDYATSGTEASAAPTETVQVFQAPVNVSGGTILSPGPESPPTRAREKTLGLVRSFEKSTEDLSRALHVKTLELVQSLERSTAEGSRTLRQKTLEAVRFSERSTAELSRALGARSLELVRSFERSTAELSPAPRKRTLELVRSFQKSTGDVRRRIRRVFGKHSQATWLLVAAVTAILIGYLIGRA